jgi:hypothetical protein
MKIVNDLWEIREGIGPDGYEYFVVYKNGRAADHLCGSNIYETMSGACFAILNEYSLED